MKLNKFTYLYSKPLGNHTLKIMKKIPGNLLKNMEISWNFVSPKSGNPDNITGIVYNSETTLRKEIRTQLLRHTIATSQDVTTQTRVPMHL